MDFLWVILLAVIAFVVYSLSRKSKPPIVVSSQTHSGYDKPTDHAAAQNSSHGTSFLPPMPKGFQIADSRLSVSGIHYRKDDALRFSRGAGQTLELEREASNPHDPNAVKVIGVSLGARNFIGYIPKDTAEQIVGGGLFEIVRPRLDRIYVSGNGFIDVQFQIICPKDKIKQYGDFLKSKPASSWEKEFYKFFGLPIPKGLTTGEAQQTIIEHKKKLTAENKAKLDEWDTHEDEQDAFDEICTEFDDPEFRAGWDLKKVSRTLLKDAVNQLKQEGATIRSLADDIDKVVEKVIALKPDIEKQ